MDRLAFMGESGSGKDFLTDILKNKGYKRISFSDSLKEIASSIYPWLEKDYPPFEKEQPLNIVTEYNQKITLTPREIWLKLNFLRDIDDNIFIRILENKLKTLDKVIISDIRTKGEYEFCLKNNFKVIYIDPIKKIYEPNDFDDYVRSKKGETEYYFLNKFDGELEFRMYLQNITKGIKDGNI